jgi:threonine synthase
LSVRLREIPEGKRALFDTDREVYDTDDQQCLCSAAIYGLRGKQDVSIYILYPYGRVSPIQEQQMATVPDENVHCVAVDGTFDDCQVCQSKALSVQPVYELMIENNVSRTPSRPSSRT